MWSGARTSAQTRPQRSKGGAERQRAAQRSDPNPERSEGEGRPLKKYCTSFLFVLPINIETNLDSYRS
jgi:hypothetical protein